MTQNSFYSGANVPDTTQEEVLLSAVEQVRRSIPAFASETTCFVSDVPWPDVSVEGRLFCTVCPVTDTFIEDEIDGGGQFMVCESSMLQVSVFSRINTDRADRTLRELTNATRGVLVYKRAVLKCFAGKNLFHREHPDRPLLIEHMKPTRALHPPSRQHEDDYASFSLTFSAKFNWDLSE